MLTILDQPISIFWGEDIIPDKIVDRQTTRTHSLEKSLAKRKIDVRS